MPKRILVDATHPEETRVVVLKNGSVQEFESETSFKAQLKGNIYLAKVTRVEPSLQAAFVEYGGNRHGFLPFSEIHPDYYNIPVNDKEELLRSLREESKIVEAEDVDDEKAEKAEKTEKSSSRHKKKKGKDDNKEEKAENNDDGDDDSEIEETGELHVDVEEEVDDFITDRSNLYRKYNIQEVIKRNQIILVQVEKEERGNKGASLTTFISLAGSYCVLMPNALRQGGVSRRIGSVEDRKKLKSILRKLNLPEETGLIIRTAGAGKAEDDIRSDYDYLVGVWNRIRELTLSSAAPAFIHSDGDVVRRTLRDIFKDDIDEIIIEGKDAYAEVKNFMSEVMPKHLAKLKPYSNKVPIFSRFRVEEQILQLFDQDVPLESGGSLVINPTEALISIDVNSGKFTSQRNVEETAVAINVEAAREVSRQLRLRDLSGLIVIDFIDMLEYKNRKLIERELRVACQQDRAKIQIGRISNFGLLEMSRQRLSSSFLEVNTMPCSHCGGSGVVKATESLAVNVLRAIESELNKGSQCEAIEVRVSQEVFIYLLNHKRPQIHSIETRQNIQVFFYPSADFDNDDYTIDKISHYDANEQQGEQVRRRKQRKRRQQENLSSHSSDVASNDDEAVDESSGRSHRRPSRRRQKEGGSGMLSGLWKKIVD